MSAPSADERFMAAALRLARWNTGLTSTNPSVGCLIVRDGVIIGQGITAPGGRPHAETQALAIAGGKAKGATAYVTLEPCSHHGKTPPCADALIAAGIARVVVSIADPDERVSGRGLERLRHAGVEVVEAVLAEEGERVLRGYLMRKRSKRPHVTLKLAVSPDGMIGRRGDGQVAVTGPVARAQVQVLRAETDAILVGIGTALADDPELTCRLPGLEDRSPVRIVLDRRLRLPLDSKLVRLARAVPLIVVAGQYSQNDAAIKSRRAALEEAGAEVLHCDPAEIGDLLAALATRGISSLLVEGGAAVVKSFLDAHLVDRLLLYTGAAEVGEGGIASPVTRSSVPGGFHLVRQDRFADDICDDYERDI